MVISTRATGTISLFKTLWRLTSFLVCDVAKQRKDKSIVSGNAHYTDEQTTASRRLESDKKAPDHSSVPRR